MTNDVEIKKKRVCYNLKLWQTLIFLYCTESYKPDIIKAEVCIFDWED